MGKITRVFFNCAKLRVIVVLAAVSATMGSNLPDLHAGISKASIEVFVRRVYHQYVNVGGSDYRNSLHYYSADQALQEGSWGYIDGTTTSTTTDITGTNDDPLYQSARQGLSGYKFTVPARGHYRVVLHFAEIRAQTSGIFDVYLENQVRLRQFDLLGSVGANAALTRSLVVNVTDAVLDIGFESQVGSPILSAIEVSLLAIDDDLDVRQDEVVLEKEAPAQPSLQNYPNPFNAGTKIRFSLLENGRIRAVIFDVRGHQTAELFDGRLSAGEHQLYWDGRNPDGREASSGIYFLRIIYYDQSGGERTVTQKLMLLK